MINMITYTFFMLVTGFLGFVRWHRRRKKNRVDTFYQRVLDIREQVRSNAGYSAEDLAQKLNAIEKEAFQLLIDEKLSADESFQIFITLLHSTFNEFKRLKKID